MKRRGLMALALALFVVTAAAVVLAYRANQRFAAFNDAGLAMKTQRADEAVRLLVPLAENGHPKASEFLGWIYAVGLEPVQQDDEEAMRWFRRAGDRRRDVPEGEDPAASYALWVGKAYGSGSDGAQQDWASSRKWLELAARGGSREAIQLIKKMDMPMAMCITEEVLREAGASEEEIRQFKEEEAKAEAESAGACG